MTNDNEKDESLNNQDFVEYLKRNQQKLGFSDEMIERLSKLPISLEDFSKSRCQTDSQGFKAFCSRNLKLFKPNFFKFFDMLDSLAESQSTLEIPLCMEFIADSDIPLQENPRFIKTWFTGSANFIHVFIDVEDQGTAQVVFPIGDSSLEELFVHGFLSLLYNLHLYLIGCINPI